ncbi:hypothetical protein [Indioceanicola profundi]|uniref:hypothetical protein n=1 Tax=Indioceanicola profundi TaxID=2220096 RepID=UPI001CEDCBBB
MSAPVSDDPHDHPPGDPTLKEERRLNRRFRRLEGLLPRPMGKGVRGLRKPGLWMVRIPVGLLLIIGGFFSFLPVLGLWMLPLGLLLLAVDLPFLQAPVSRAMVRVERWWQNFRRRHRSDDSQDPA